MSIAAIVLGLTALGGGVAATIRLRGRNPPKPLVLVHALAAAAGLSLVVVHCVQHGWPRPASIALAILVTAAFLGFLAGRRHARGDLVPLGLIAGHASIAIFGLVFVIVVAIARGDVPAP